MIAVLAGNYRQFLLWCRDNRMQPDRDARHIRQRHHVQGMFFDERTRAGRWWEAPKEAQDAYFSLRFYMGRNPQAH